MIDIDQNAKIVECPSCGYRFQIVINKPKIKAIFEKRW
jgi:DNA-directed RNA polymerase subunit RPC12/RpoP